MKTAIALALLVAAILAIVLVARRAEKGFESFLVDHGFAKQPQCPIRIVVRDHDLRDATCWHGPLSASITGDVVTGYIPSAARRGYRYFLGVIIPASVKLDDAWLRRWNEQDVYRAADGSIVVLWNLVDERKNAQRVLDAIRAALPS